MVGARNQLPTSENVISQVLRTRREYDVEEGAAGKIAQDQSIARTGRRGYDMEEHTSQSLLLET